MDDARYSAPMTPTFEDVMKPLLELVATRGEISLAAARDELATTFGLSDDERTQLLPSGRATRWASRVHWAKTYLYKAGLIDAPRRGTIAANAETRRILATNPARVDKALLLTVPKFVEWLDRTVPEKETGTSAIREPSDGATPREQLDRAYASLKHDVLDDLLERVREVEPAQFERLVVQLMTRLGYGGPLGGAEHLGGSGDGGVDGVIREDKLGLELVYLQAKRWKDPVSRPSVQSFVGSLEGFRSRKGVFITTSTFSREAREYVRQIEKRIVLIDGHELAELMYEAGLGVATDQTFELKSIDTDFFTNDLD